MEKERVETIEDNGDGLLLYTVTETAIVRPEWPAENLRVQQVDAANLQSQVVALTAQRARLVQEKASVERLAQNQLESDMLAEIVAKQQDKIAAAVEIHSAAIEIGKVPPVKDDPKVKGKP